MKRREEALEAGFAAVTEADGERRRVEVPLIMERPSGRPLSPGGGQEILIRGS